MTYKVYVDNIGKVCEEDTLPEAMRTFIEYEKGLNIGLVGDRVILFDDNEILEETIKED